MDLARAPAKEPLEDRTEQFQDAPKEYLRDLVLRLMEDDKPAHLNGIESYLEAEEQGWDERDKADRVGFENN